MKKLGAHCIVCFYFDNFENLCFQSHLLLRQSKLTSTSKTLGMSRCPVMVINWAKVSRLLNNTSLAGLDPEKLRKELANRFPDVDERCEALFANNVAMHTYKDQVRLEWKISLPNSLSTMHFKISNTLLCICISNGLTLFIGLSDSRAKFGFH